MKARKVLAFLMVGLLGANVSFASAEVQPRLEIKDSYSHDKTVSGCSGAVVVEGLYYGVNQFLGGTACHYNHFTETYATTLIASQDPEEGNYCPAETKSVVNQGTSVINQNSFPNAIANCYQTTGVTFRHHHQNAQGAMMYFYTETVKE